VVVLWQWLLSCAARVELRWPHRFILGASVWLAYGADRWFEGWRLKPDCVRTARHRFYQRYRWPVAAVWLLGFAADLEVAITRLNHREFASGIVLLAPVLAYLLSHQLVHRHHPWRAPKELCVGALLGGGAAIFVIAQPSVALGPLIAASALFATLCFANVALISVWEHDVDLTHGQTSLVHQFRRGAAFSRTLPWTIAVVAALLSITATGAVRATGLCVVGSGLLLGLIDRAEPRLGWRLAHVLADLVLLTPLVPLTSAHPR
jgi:hypothetical protein